MFGGTVRTWMFVVPLLAAACSGDGGKDTAPTSETSDTGTAGTDDPVVAILALTGDPINGDTLYNNNPGNCVFCHGADGSGGTGTALTNPNLQLEAIVEIVYYGEGIMSSYADAMTDQEIADVAAYVKNTFASR